MDTYNAWRIQKRPFFKRLPSEQSPNSYQDNTVVDWLTSYYDQLFVSCLTKLEDLPRQFNPELCDPEWLDFLSVICGWTGVYWDKDYPVQSKRILLKNSFTQIWNKKGTRECLSFVLNALEVNHKIIEDGAFILGESQVSIDTLGSGEWEFVILLPTSYKSIPSKLRLTKKIASLFCPIWCKYTVEYETL